MRLVFSLLQVALLHPSAVMAANTGNSRSIANIIRKAVSQKRVRFQDGRFDLDLTYITKEVIAMGLPASGVHSLYRNKVQDVSDMLNQYHPGKYVSYSPPLPSHLLHIVDSVFFSLFSPPRVT